MDAYMTNCIAPQFLARWVKSSLVPLFLKLSWRFFSRRAFLPLLQKAAALKPGPNLCVEKAAIVQVCEHVFLSKQIWSSRLVQNISLKKGILSPRFEKEYLLIGTDLLSKWWMLCRCPLLLQALLKTLEVDFTLTGAPKLDSTCQWRSLINQST